MPSARALPTDDSASFAQVRYNLSDEIFDQSIITLTRIMELTVQAGNGTGDTTAILQEIDALKEVMVEMANTKDSQGQALFSGFRTKSVPFEIQLDGSVSPFDQLAKIVDAVGDKIDVICEGGIQRGTHVLKALSIGAKACAGGRLYLYALASAGEKGVERALSLLKEEIIRDMKLMGCTSIDQLNRSNLHYS